MDDYRLQNLSDEELNRKINQLRVLIWSVVGIILAVQVFLLMTGRSSFLLIALVFFVQINITKSIGKERENYEQQPATC